MSNTTISEELRRTLLEKLDGYKEMIVENADLYFKLVKLIEKKTNTNINQNNSLEINRALISKLDDITEDLVTANFNMKVLKYSINNNLPISLSERESEREQRVQNIRRNNILPALFLMYNLVENEGDISN